MSSSSIKIQLLMGPVVPVPAPTVISEALSQVEITRKDEAPSGFQLTFHARKEGSGIDYSIADHPLLLPFNRVIVVAWLGSFYKVLMDGYITNRELSPPEGDGAARLTVTGEDVSVKMDMVEVSFSYPFFPKLAQVFAIMARYAALGVVPMPIPVLGDLPDIDTTDQQVTTDRKFLQQLAGLVGYKFSVLPGPAPGLNLAYWGPPNRLLPPQVPLTINLGSRTNVESMSASHNGLAPRLQYGTCLVGDLPMPFAGVGVTRIPPFAVEPLGRLMFAPLALVPETLPAWLPILAVRGKYTCYNRVDSYMEVLKKAEGEANLEGEETVTLQGELDTALYGSILTSPGIVGVRGMGISFDGFYVVKEVVHSINLDHGSLQFKQKFTLTREGMITTTPAVAGFTTPLF
ncbi:MAG: hypothetical protein ACE5GX_02470 [Thermoanaerobaculia bacterium]